MEIRREIVRNSELIQEISIQAIQQREPTTSGKKNYTHQGTSH